VVIRLTNHLELNKLIHPHQYGFQRNMSTEYNLLKVIDFIGTALDNGEFCIGVFLDLRKAFDVCHHDVLFKKLEKLGITGVKLQI